MSIADIADELYQAKPIEPLFHYTTLGGLICIVRAKSLRASDLRYFNDASEMEYTANLMSLGIRQRENLNAVESKILDQFDAWMHDRLSHGHMLFAVCFTTDGNLLSQWRGYAKPSKGVSLGFAADKLLACAYSQSFQLVACNIHL
jgi:hypothetical protein